MKRLMVVLAVAAVFMFPISSVMAQVDYCEGNFDYDQDVDGVDAFQFKTDFGRSKIADPCPIDGPAPVPKTGQTYCYDDLAHPIDCTGTGEDGEYQKGVASPSPRFYDNDDGTVRDNLTGLIWLKNANCFGVRAWWLALADCNALTSGQCGLTDGSIQGEWRLPNIKEMQSLIDFGHYAPALPSGHPFVNVRLSINYWSSTTIADGTVWAWAVNMTFGVVNHEVNSNSYYVWPVRGGH